MTWKQLADRTAYGVLALYLGTVVLMMSYEGLPRMYRMLNAPPPPTYEQMSGRQKAEIERCAVLLYRKLVEGCPNLSSDEWRYALKRYGDMVAARGTGR